MADDPKAEEQKQQKQRDAEQKVREAKLKGVFANPDFRKLSSIDKIQFMKDFEPDFGNLQPVDQARAIQNLLQTVPMERLPSTNVPVDVAYGFVGEALRPVATVTDIARRAMGKEPISGRPKVQLMLNPPASKAGKVGAIAEPIAELALPWMKGLKAVEAPTLLKSGATVMRETWPSLVRRMTVEGARMGTQAYLHGDKPIPGAILGAAGPAAGRLLQELAPATERYAGWLYRRALDPTKTVPKIQTGEIVPELLQRRFWAATWPRLKSSAERNLEAAGKNLEQVEEATVLKHSQTFQMTGVGRSPYGPVINMQKGAFSLRPVLDELQAAMDKTMVRGRFPTQQARMEYRLLADQYRRLAQYGNSVTLREAIDIRRLLDKPLGQKGAFQVTPKWATIEEVQLKAANKLRGLINDQFPEIAAANHEYHLWKSLQNIMKETEQRKVGQAGGLAQVLASGGAMLHGILTGKDVVKGLRDVMLANAAFAAARAPGFKTLRAVEWQRLADALEGRDLEGFLRAAGTVLRPRQDDSDAPPLVEPERPAPAPDGGRGGRPTPFVQGGGRGAPREAAAVPASGSAGFPAEVSRQIAETGRQLGGDQMPELPRIMQLVAAKESGGKQIDPKTGDTLKSEDGAMGIMQLTQETADRYGVDPHSAEGSIRGGGLFLRDLITKYGSSREELPKVFAAYYGGEGPVDKYNGVPPRKAAPRTVQYVIDMMAKMGFRWTPSAPR